MKQGHRIGLWMVAGLTVLMPLAAGQQSAQGFDVDEQVAGTMLSIEPGQSYDTATLSVVGPHGFEANGRFTGGPLFLDLAVAGKLPTAQQAARGAVADGQYRWEVRLARGDGTESVATGSFKVENGVAVPRSQQRSALSYTGDELLRAREPLKSPSTGASEIGGESLNVDDILWVVDDQNDKVTSVQLLLGNSTDGYDFRFWNLTNDDGLFRIDRSTNFIPPGSNKLSINEDGNVGLSTTTAAKRLHIHTTTVGDGIRLVNDAGAFETSWDLAVDAFAGITFRDVETGNGVMRLREGAPSESLVITSAGDVGMGTASPSAKLHVAGGGIIEGDVALGSSRTIKHAFESLDSAAVLATVRDLPLYRWKYKEDPEQAPHVGPMAEDVFRAFAIGRDDKHLSPADSAGLALASVQGLGSRLDRELAELRAEFAELASRNAELRSENQHLRQQLSNAREPGTDP